MFGLHEQYNFLRCEVGGEIRVYPRLPITIRNPFNGRDISAIGIVDTGADCCLFSHNVCDLLGHDFSGAGVKSSITAGVGGVVKTRLHTFEIDLLAEHGKYVAWSSGRMEVECFKNTQTVVLLGVKGFLENFKVTFDYVHKELTVKDG